MTDLKVPFTATINPCVVTLTTIVAPPLMETTLGDPGISSTYEIEQTPSCYTETVTVDVPWLTVDPNTGTGVLDLPQSFDRSIIGTHTVTLTKTVT